VAVVGLTTSPTTLDAGSSDSVMVTNTGSVAVTVSRGSQSFPLQAGQSVTVYPEGTAVTAVTASGTGQVTTSTTAKPLPNAADPATLAANSAFTGTYAGLLPASSSYTYNADGSIATETVAGITTTYTYNTDGSIATMVRSGVTRTFSYNTDGTIATVA
jgi:YD repeat-containing protein